MSVSYESDKLLNEYLLMHYGSDELLMPWGFGPKGGLHFPVRTAARFPEGGVGRALDVGCAVGRASFELSRTAEEVVGVDYSANFIAAARHLAADGELHYAVKETGDKLSQAVARPPEGSHPDRCRFLQADAMGLPEELGSFDRVHVANLICRLSRPEKFLDRCPELVVPGGYLLLATPCTWLDEFTPPESQPAGDTFEWLKSRLGGDFSLEGCEDEPFLIRETSRKFQWSVALTTLWRRL